jgi:hypothetical protein
MTNWCHLRMKPHSNAGAVIAEILRAVLNKKVDPKTAILKWPDIDNEKDKTILAAWHELYDYSIDADIREKDPGYGENQRKRLRWYLEEIERSRKKPGTPFNS